MQEVEVLIIGGGFGGIGMASQLAQAGYKPTVIEAADTIGGVWRPGAYPGSSCDVPAPLYSFSYFIDATPGYPPADHTYRYLVKLVERYNLWPHIRLNHIAKALTYRESDGHWIVTTVNTASNEIVEFDAEFVVSAIGQLQRAKLPDIPGMDDFQGDSWHVSKWPHDQDLSSANVAVIGTGASTAQLVPELAQLAHTVNVYQRTAPWVLPRAAEEPSRLMKWAFKHLPRVAPRLYRWAAYIMADLALTPLSRKNGWTRQPLSALGRRHLHKQVPDPDLRAMLTPTHQLGCKRPIVSNVYYPALMRPNVELVAEQIVQITPTGIVTNQGLKPATHIVYATGYNTTDFLRQLRVTGPGGVTLDQIWEKSGVGALHGVGLKDMPNLACLHGPWSFGDNTSNVFVNERQAMIVLDLLNWWWPHRKTRSLMVRPNALQDHTQRRQRRMTDSSYVTCGSWYRSTTGDVLNPAGESPMHLWWASVRGIRRCFQLVPLSR